MALSKPATGRGSYGDSPPSHGGGGGEPGGGNSPNYPERLRRARMGLAVALAPVVMLFVAFSAAFVARRVFGSSDLTAAAARWISTPLPWVLLLLNTAVLLLSSVTIELARRHATMLVALAPVKSIPGVSLGEEHSFPWLGTTTVLGLLFLGGQVRAWMQLEAHGILVSSSASSSFFYLLTGMHAVHLAGGVLGLLYASYGALRHYAVERQRIIIDVAAWYWHFMAGLWLYILLLIAVAR